MKRTALVTGASSGFGELFARRLAAVGCDLVLTARREELLEALAAELREKDGVAVEVIPADLADDEGVARLVGRLGMGDVAVLVNNAGFSADGSLVDADIERLVDMVKVHDIATVRLTRAALPHMLERSSGDIINVASLAGILPVRFNVVYNASKAFLVMFSESLSNELAGTGVQVQALCPTYTHTGFQGVMGKTPDAGSIMWNEPEQVVDESLAALGSGKVVLVPGAITRTYTAAANAMPRRLRLRVLRRVTREPGLKR